MSSRSRIKQQQSKDTSNEEENSITTDKECSSISDLAALINNVKDALTLNFENRYCSTRKVSYRENNGAPREYCQYSTECFTKHDKNRQTGRSNNTTTKANKRSNIKP